MESQLAKGADGNIQQHYVNISTYCSDTLVSAGMIRGQSDVGTGTKQVMAGT